MSKTQDKTDKIQVKATIEVPFTDQDYEEIDSLCEVLIIYCEKMRENNSSCYAKRTASDIIDMIVDLKIDMSDFAQEHAQKIEGDGFVTMVGKAEEEAPYE